MWIMPIRPLCRRQCNVPGHGRSWAVPDSIIQGLGLEILKEFQEGIRRLVSGLPAAGRSCFLDRLLLLLHVSMQVLLRTGDGLVAEPEGDHGDVDAGQQESHCCGVPERVDGDVLGSQGRAAGDARVRGRA